MLKYFLKKKKIKYYKIASKITKNKYLPFIHNIRNMTLLWDICPPNQIGDCSFINLYFHSLPWDYQA